MFYSKKRHLYGLRIPHVKSSKRKKSNEKENRKKKNPKGLTKAADFEVIPGEDERANETKRKDVLKGKNPSYTLDERRPLLSLSSPNKMPFDGRVLGGSTILFLCMHHSRSKML